MKGRLFVGAAFIISMILVSSAQADTSPSQQVLLMRALPRIALGFITGMGMKAVDETPDASFEEGAEIPTVVINPTRMMDAGFENVEKEDLCLLKIVDIDTEAIFEVIHKSSNKSLKFIVDQEGKIKPYEGK